MIIGVTGGKGGTGKSTVATSLAVYLSQKGKTLLVDADVGCPNDHLLLTIKREKIDSVYQTIPLWQMDKCTKCGICSKVCQYNAIVQVKEKYPIFVEEQCNGCRACIIACPKKAISEGKKEIGEIFIGKREKLDFLTGEILPGQESEEPIVQELVKRIDKSYDYVVIDTAAGTHCDVIKALEPCDIALAVTEPTHFGAHDLDLILKLLEKLKKQRKIILNKSDVGKKELIQKIACKHDVKIISEIPYSRKIMEKYIKGEPVQNSAVRKIIDSL